MRDTDYARCAELQTIELPDAQVIINGEVRQQSTTVLTCPNCGTMVAQIGDNLDEATALKICSNIFQQQLSNIKRCVNCAQRLYFPSIIPVVES